VTLGRFCVIVRSSCTEGMRNSPNPRKLVPPVVRVTERVARFAGVAGKGVNPVMGRETREAVAPGVPVPMAGICPLPKTVCFTPFETNAADEEATVR